MIKTSREIAKKRMTICKSCPKLFKPTKTCKECGCFMSVKVWVSDADCPLNKWESEQPTRTINH